MLRVSKNSDDPFGILKTTKLVLDKAKQVQINPQSIEKLSRLIDKKLEKGLDEDEYELGITGDLEKDIQLLLVEDSVNFCFWAEKGKEKWKIEWPKGKIVSGGWYGLIASFERAIAEKIPILDPDFLTQLTVSDVKKIFRSASSSEVPLIEKRLENLVEVGKVLINKFNGSFINLVEEARFNAVGIIKLVYDNFSSFRDVAQLSGNKVYFLKRAQLLANDLSYIAKREKRFNIKGLEKLTAFADYKIPQILRHFGVISYSSKLAGKVDNFYLIPAFSPEEIEIRAATIRGVDLIKKYLKKYPAAKIDNAIWLISQDQSSIDKPYHRTYTIFY